MTSFGGARLGSGELSALDRDCHSCNDAQVTEEGPPSYEIEDEAGQPATIRLHLEGPQGAIDFDTFVRAMERTLLVLRDVDRVISGRPGGAVRWKVADMGTASIDAVLRAEARSRKLAAFPVRVAAGSVEAFSVAEAGEMLPPYLSDKGLTHLEKLANGLGRDGATGLGVTFVERDAHAHVTNEVRERMQKLRVPAVHAIGSVTGMLEAISLHGKPKYSVYDAVTRRAVSSMFTETELEHVKQALGKRVNVAGVIYRNARGQPLRVERAKLTILPAGDELPSVRDFVGSDPAFTGDLTTDEYVRRLRDA